MISPSCTLHDYQNKGKGTNPILFFNTSFLNCLKMFHANNLQQILSLCFLCACVCVGNCSSIIIILLIPLFIARGSIFFSSQFQLTTYYSTFSRTSKKKIKSPLFQLFHQFLCGCVELISSPIVFFFCKVYLQVLLVFCFSNLISLIPHELVIIFV
jgi:hypothetical protein